MKKPRIVAAALHLLFLVQSQLRVRRVIRTAIRFLPVLLARTASPSTWHRAERRSRPAACSFVVVFRKARNELFNELAETGGGHPYRRILQVFPSFAGLRS